MSTPIFPGVRVDGTSRVKMRGPLYRGVYDSDRDRIALMVLHDVANGRGPDDVVLSINPYDEALARDEVCIKNYSGHEGVVEALVDAGIVDPPHRWIRQGRVERVPIVRLRLAIAKLPGTP